LIIDQTTKRASHGCRIGVDFLAKLAGKITWLFQCHIAERFLLGEVCLHLLKAALVDGGDLFVLGFCCCSIDTFTLENEATF